jgi:hypothetical protein
VILYSVANNESLVSSGKLASEYLAIGKTLQAMGQIKHPVTLSSVADFNFLK